MPLYYICRLCFTYKCGSGQVCNIAKVLPGTYFRIKCLNGSDRTRGLFIFFVILNLVELDQSWFDSRTVLHQPSGVMGWGRRVVPPLGRGGWQDPLGYPVSARTAPRGHTAICLNSNSAQCHPL